jgi:hypothetical protein
MSVYLTGMHLTGVYLAGMHLMGIHLISKYFLEGESDVFLSLKAGPLALFVHGPQILRLSKLACSLFP